MERLGAWVEYYSIVEIGDVACDILEAKSRIAKLNNIFWYFISNVLTIIKNNL